LGAVVILSAPSFFDYSPNRCMRPLNMAEIELSILGRQCLDRRMADMDTLKREVAAWQDERNHEETWIDWRFKTADA
jgi:hypothetical protein